MAEGRIIPVAEVHNFADQAPGFRSLLLREDNQDIALDFPSTVGIYSGPIDEALVRFERAQAAHSEGWFLQYLIQADEQTVGLAKMRVNPEKTPAGADAAWPNISMFICHPFRGQGLGGLGIRTLLSVAKESYGGAWTGIRESNTPSRGLAVSVGFTLLGRRPPEEGKETILLYGYSPTGNLGAIESK